MNEQEQYRLFLLALRNGLLDTAMAAQVASECLRDVDYMLAIDHLDPEMPCHALTTELAWNWWRMGTDRIEYHDNMTRDAREAAAWTMAWFEYELWQLQRTPAHIDAVAYAEQQTKTCR